MVLRLVPETEERDSNSPQGLRLTFNGHGHRVFTGWQGRGIVARHRFPPPPVRAEGETIPLPSWILDFVRFFSSLSFLAAGKISLLLCI